MVTNFPASVPILHLRETQALRDPALRDGRNTIGPLGRTEELACDAIGRLRPRRVPAFSCSSNPVATLQTSRGMSHVYDGEIQNFSKCGDYS